MSNEYDSLIQQTPEAQAKAVTNEYDGLIVDLDQERRQRGRASIMGAQDANPDQTAKALALSKKTGVPVDTVERDIKAVEGPLAVSEYDALVQKNPGLGKWLEDPVNARLAKDDLDSLGHLDKALRKQKAMQTPSESADFEATVHPQPGGFLYGPMHKPEKGAPLFLAQLQTGFEQSAAGLANLENIATIRALQEIDDIEKGVKPSAGQKSAVRMMSPEQRAQYKQELEAKVIKLGAQIKQSKEYVGGLPVEPGVKKFKTAADAVVWADVLDRLLSVIGNAGSPTRGDDFMAPSSHPGAVQIRNLIAAFTDNAPGLIQHGTVTNAPSVVATVGGYALGGPVGAAVAGGVSDFPSRLEDVVADRVRDVLATSDVAINLDDPQAVNRFLRDNPKILTDAALSAGAGSASIALTEGLIGKIVRPLKAGAGVARNVAVAGGNIAMGVGTEIAGETVARAVAGQDPDLNESLMEGIGAVGQTTATTVVKTIQEGGEARADKKAAVEKAKEALASATELLGDIRKQMAETGALWLDDVIEKATATKLAGRSTEKLEEFLTSVAGEDQNVFVPADVVQTYLQSKPLEDMQRFADALGISEQLPEALARGGDVVIPLAKYVTEAGKSDAHKAWLNDLRLEVDGLSVRQAEEDAKTQKERTKLAVERFEAQLEAGIAEVDATTRVYEDMRDKLKTMGQYTNEAAEQQAALFAERYSARAARNPGSYLDAWDAYSKAGTGKGLEIQTVLSDRVRAMPPDDLDLLLNSIRSGKEPPIRAPIARPAPQSHGELVTSLRSALPESGKVPDSFQPDSATMETARRLSRGWGPEKHVKAPASLLSFVRSMGGINIKSSEAGDLRAADLGRIPGLLQNKRGRKAGRSIDHVAQAAQEAGYRFGKETQYGSGVDVDAFVSALIDDASGRKVYPDDEHTAAWQAQREYFDQYAEWLKDDIQWEPKGRDPREIAWFLSQDQDAQRLMALAERIDNLGPETSLEALNLIDAQLAAIEREALDRLVQTAERPEGWEADLDGAQSEVENRPLTLEEWKALHAELDRTLGDEESIGRGAEPVDEAGGPARSGDAATGNVAAGGASREASRDGQGGRRLDPRERFRADRSELASALFDLGLDTKKLTNAQIRKAIKEAVEKKRGGQTFEQPAWHGSPHIFDKFDLSKIGTGEGAQAYGWGLYLAGNKEVAKYYREKLVSQRVGAAQRAIGRADGDVDAAIASVEQAIQRLKNLPNAGGDAAKRDRFIALNEEKLAELKVLKANGLTKGRLYQVEIPDDGAYLHWDKPIEEQSESVKSAIDKLRGLDAPPLESRSLEELGDIAQAMDPQGIWSLANQREEFGRVLSREEMLQSIRDNLGVETDKRERLEIAASDTGQTIYRRLSEIKGSPRAASLALREAGIPGIQYLDGGSRSDGEGSHNYVLFDDSLAEIKTYEQANRRELIIQHNLSAENLLHADRMGGIAAPSLAITKAKQPTTSFGEITLIGPKEMADPKGYASPRVFGADIYSPRYPDVQYKLDKTSVRKLNDILAPFREEGVRERYTEILRADDLRGDKAFERYAEQNFKRDGYADYRAAGHAILQEAGAAEVIFKGFTNSGNRSYTPHTLETVLRILKKELRGGEGFSYGVGSLRSKFTPQFRSVAQIKKNADRLLTKEEFETVKKEIDAEFWEIAGQLQPYSMRGKEFGFGDAVINAMSEAPKIGLRRAFDEYNIKDVPDDVLRGAAEFLEKLRHLPTEYFEAKILRGVGMSEFRIAIVPDNVDQKVRDILEKRGVQIVEYKKGDEADRRRAIAEASEAQADDVLFQEARGQISFTDNSTIISLFQSRDLSTLIHEGGHLFLAELEFDAKAPDAPDQIKKDWQAVLDWLGSKDGYITRDMHEQFARGFETYVMEGKAPSSALASAFRSFKRWLTQIYKRLSALDSPLTPEVREVFDRLLATDEQIATAQTKQGLNPVFTDAKSAGMTEAEFAAYTARANAVVEEAEQRLLQKTMDTIRKQRTKEWKADEKAVREEVTQEVMSESGQQALALLTKGEFPVGETPEVMKGVKLAKESVVEAYGDESILTLLPAGIYRDRASGPGVMSADELAPMLGLGSGKELIERLTQLEAEKRALAAKGDNRSVAKARIDEETAQRMRERYGDPLNDGTIEQEAMAAVHSDKQAALMATDLRILARKAGHTGTVTLDDIQTWAAESIADKKVRDGTRSEQYARAERDAGKRVERALMKGNFVEAFKAKQDQLVNLALYRESQKAAADVEAARKLMDRYASADTIKSMDQEYLEQIHQLLENYEFKRRSDKLLAERKSFEEWAVEQEAMGHEVIAPPRLDKGLFSVNYRDMTVDELRGLTDTVKQIAHLGRFKKEMLDGQKKREFEAVIAEAIASVQAIPQRGVSQVRRGMTNLQAKMGDVGSWFRSADAALLKMETVFEWLDGDKTGRGVFQRVVFQRMAEAQTVERDLQKKLNTQLTAIHEKVPLEQRKRWTDVLTLPELGQKLNRSQLIAVALNIGNEGNLDKLLRGEKWDEKAVRAVLDKHLTKEEWQFVQDSWDLVNSLWPDVEAMERRVNGVAPPKVEALEVPTPFGTLKGGYYPAVYDPKASVEGDKIGAMKAEGLFDPAYRKATTRAGSTRKRTGAAYPMLLSLQVIGQHLNEVSHDIAFREAVIDAYRFLTDKRIKEAVNEALGPEYSAQFEPWVKHIANEWAIDRKGTQDIEKFMDGLRTNVTVVGMGFRASTMLSQVAGYANSIQRLGTIGMASGMRAFLKNPMEAARTVHAKSGEMRHRMNDLERDIKAALQKIEGKSGLKADAQRFAFRGIALFDAVVTIPTWLGAHTKGLKDGMTDKEASAYADKMVRDTQGSGAAKDLAAIQRGGPLMKLFTMFYSYFNVFYNRQRSLARDVREVRSVGQGMDALAQSFWLLVVPSLLAPYLAGQGPDDDEEWGNWVARNLFFGLFSGLPYVRDAANTANNMAGGKGNFGGTKLSPVQTVWDTAFHTGKDVARLIEGEDVSETAIKSVFNTAGLVLGLPTGQIGATTQFLWDALISGSQDPQTLKDWMDGLTYGPERKK